MSRTDQRMTPESIVNKPLTSLIASMARVRLLLTLLAVFVFVPITTTSVRAQSASSIEEIPTLDDIVIEGELAVPQVLFITARDQYRYDDYMYAAYLSPSVELARDAVLPMWIGLAPSPLAVRVSSPAESTETAFEAQGDGADAPRSNE